jgi:hypothetical protein
MWLGLMRRPDNGKTIKSLEEMMLFKTFSMQANGNPLLCQDVTWGYDAYFNKDSNGEPIF